MTTTKVTSKQDLTWIDYTLKFLAFILTTNIVSTFLRSFINLTILIYNSATGTQQSSNALYLNGKRTLLSPAVIKWIGFKDVTVPRRAIFDFLNDPTSFFSSLPYYETCRSLVLWLLLVLILLRLWELWCLYRELRRASRGLEKGKKQCSDEELVKWEQDIERREFLKGISVGMIMRGFWAEFSTLLMMACAGGVIRVGLEYVV